MEALYQNPGTYLLANGNWMGLCYGLGMTIRESVHEKETLKHWFAGFSYEFYRAPSA